jgi:hypothetical protein
VGQSSSKLIEGQSVRVPTIAHLVTRGTMILQLTMKSAGMQQRDLLEVRNENARKLQGNLIRKQPPLLGCSICHFVL